VTYRSFLPFNFAFPLFFIRTFIIIIWLSFSLILSFHNFLWALLAVRIFLFIFLFIWLRVDKTMFFSRSPLAFFELMNLSWEFLLVTILKLTIIFNFFRKSIWLMLQFILFKQRFYFTSHITSFIPIFVFILPTLRNWLFLRFSFVFWNFLFWILRIKFFRFFLNFVKIICLGFVPTELFFIEMFLLLMATLFRGLFILFCGKWICQNHPNLRVVKVMSEIVSPMGLS